MTRSQKQYADAFSYEALMTRAFRKSPNFNKGTDRGEFCLLEHLDNGHAPKGLTYAKQMQKLKGLLTKAVEKILKWKLTVSERTAISRYAEMIGYAGDGDDLAIAVNGLLEATHRLKEL